MLVSATWQALRLLAALGQGVSQTGSRSLTFAPPHRIEVNSRAPRASRKLCCDRLVLGARFGCKTPDCLPARKKSLCLLHQASSSDAVEWNLEEGFCAAQLVLLT